MLHFRIFNPDGEIVVDTDSNELKEQSAPIKSLSQQLKGVFTRDELTEAEKFRVIDTVTGVVDLNHAVHPSMLVRRIASAQRA